VIAMADPMRKVNPGDPLVIPAQTYNAMLDVIGRDARAAFTQEVRPSSKMDNTIRVATAFYNPLEQYSVQVLQDTIVPSGVSLSERWDSVVFYVSPPNQYAGFHNRFVILAEPLKPGEIARAWVSGLCPVKVNVTDPYTDCVDLVPSVDSYLETCHAGRARIIWRETYGTVLTWAIVDLDAKNYFHGVFPIGLVPKSGNGGDASHPATWRYDIFKVNWGDGVLLASDVDPTQFPHYWQRPPTGPVLAAHYGLAWYRTPTELRITWINEVHA